MDIYQALTKDHNALKPLLTQLVTTSQMNASTKSLLNQINDALVPHSRAEEAVFYNALRSIDSIKDEISHSYREHMTADAILRTLQGLQKIDVDWTTAAEKLRDTLTHHVAEEETRIFSLARQVLSVEEAEQMAAAFERLKLEASRKGDWDNTLDLIGHMMPQRFSSHLRS